MPSLWRTVVSVSALVLLVASLGCSKPGVRELQQSRDAVRAAKSWEVDATQGATTTMLFQEKVECPSRRDMMWTVRPPENPVMDNDGRMVVHDIWHDGDRFTSDGQTWHHFAGAEKVLPNKLTIGCGVGPALVWDGALYANLDAEINSGELRKGPTMTINGGECTWWDVAPAKSQEARYTVCVDSATHLPRVVRTRERGNEYTYTLTRWNETSVGLPPELM